MRLIVADLQGAPYLWLDAPPFYVVKLLPLRPHECSLDQGRFADFRNVPQPNTAFIVREGVTADNVVAEFTYMVTWIAVMGGGIPWSVGVDLLNAATIRFAFGFATAHASVRFAERWAR